MLVLLEGMFVSAVHVNKNKKDATCNRTSIEQNHLGLKVHLTDVLDKTYLHWKWELRRVLKGVLLGIGRLLAW